MLTIITPTYNRREIENLWKSLQNQTCGNFEWLVVDDGSTDNTKDFIEQIQAVSNFSVRYIYKENGGKHTALNVGIATIKNELTFIVDSDDCLTPNAVESIYEIHDKYKGREEICGYSFLRMFPNGIVNGKKFPSDELVGSYIDVRINGNDTHSDKAEVFLTEYLREFPFPEYSGEKFIGEDIVWVRMARKYQMVHINKAIYIGKYLEDGLTNNRRKNNIASPVGCMHRAEEFLKPDINLRYRLKGGLQYIIYGRFAGMSTRKLIKNSCYRWVVVPCIIPGLFLYWYWKRIY